MARPALPLWRVSWDSKKETPDRAVTGLALLPQGVGCVILEPIAQPTRICFRAAPGQPLIHSTESSGAHNEDVRAERPSGEMPGGWPFVCCAVRRSTLWFADGVCRVDAPRK